MTRHANPAAPISRAGLSTTAPQENTQRAFSLKSGGGIHGQGAPTVYPTVRANSRVDCYPPQHNGIIQSETAIAVSGNAVVITYNDFRGFYCPFLPPGYQVTGWAFSLDGGQTFTDGGPLPGGAALAGDGEMAVGPDGTIYLASLLNNLTGVGILQGTVTDTGISWTNPTIISGDGRYDKENIAVDPATGFIYVTYTLFGSPDGIRCTHSEDGGVTFLPAVSVRSGSNPQLQGSAPVIGPNGEVYVAYNIGYPADTGVGFAVSYDNGSTFVNRGQIANTARFTVSGADRAPAFPQNAVDNNPESPYYGTIYVAWHSVMNGQGEAVMTKSTDGGTTWNPAMPINPDFGPGIEYMPTLSVDNQGRVNAFFYSRRGETGTNTDLYFAQSVDGGNSFTSPTQVNEVPSNWHLVGDGTPAWGDYINSVTIGTDAYVAYADGRDGDPDAYLGHVFIP
jgi:hypothetical protein